MKVLIAWRMADSLKLSVDSMHAVVPRNLLWRAASLVKQSNLDYVEPHTPEYGFDDVVVELLEALDCAIEEERGKMPQEELDQGAHLARKFFVEWVHGTVRLLPQ